MTPYCADTCALQLFNIDLNTDGQFSSCTKSFFTLFDTRHIALYRKTVNEELSQSQIKLFVYFFYLFGVQMVFENKFVANKAFKLIY